MVNSIKFNNRTSAQFIDQVMLFSILPGLAILFFLLTDFSGGIRTLVTILFLSFYPGYLLVRRLSIEGDLFKIVLSTGLSLSMITALALTTLTLSFWNPILQTGLIVLVVLADALIGKHSLFRPSPAEINIPLFEDPHSKLAVNRPHKRFILSRKYLIENRPKSQPKANYIWGVEFISVKNGAGAKVISALVISDLITDECHLAVPLKAHRPELIISHLSWLFLTQDPPCFLEINPINDTNGYIYFNWLQKNYSKVGLIPPDQRNRPKAHSELDLHLRRLNLAGNTPVKNQLEAWKDSYNRGLVRQNG